MGNLSKTLWKDNTDMAEACLKHPFVQGLKDGSLDKEAFKCYVAQDVFYLKAYLKAYALAAAKCDSIEHAQFFHGLMQAIFDELKLHKSYAAEWDIDLKDVKPLPATKIYTTFLLEVAQKKPVGDILAAMMPCMRLYAYLGKAIEAGNTDENPYKKWIATYADKEYQAVADKVEAMMDTLTKDTKEVRESYRFAMQCELDFFSNPIKKVEEQNEKS